jgi:hypothetical protein
MLTKKIDRRERKKRKRTEQIYVKDGCATIAENLAAKAATEREKEFNHKGRKEHKK